MVLTTFMLGATRLGTNFSSEKRFFTWTLSLELQSMRLPSAVFGAVFGGHTTGIASMKRDVIPGLS